MVLTIVFVTTGLLVFLTASVNELQARLTPDLGLVLIGFVGFFSFFCFMVLG